MAAPSLRADGIVHRQCRWFDAAAPEDHPGWDDASEYQGRNDASSQPGGTDQQ
jgi:hypothetical protein